MLNSTASASVSYNPFVPVLLMPRGLLLCPDEGWNENLSKRETSLHLMGEADLGTASSLIIVLNAS